MDGRSFKAANFWEKKELNAGMTVTIDIEKFRSNWTAIFMEIEKQINLKEFSFIEPATASIHNRIRPRKQRSFSEMEPASMIDYKQGCKQEVIGHRRNVQKPRERNNSMSTPKIDTDKMLRDPRLTDAARKLSKKEMKLLYEDILKPLDVYSILRERRAQLELREEMLQ